MPVTVEWLEKPHLLQITYQGKVTLEEVSLAWEKLHAMHLADPAQPFCTLSFILPDRQLPTGMLKLATHPVLRHLKNTTAAAVVGIDHFMVNLLLEMLAKVPFAPKFLPFKTREAALDYLREIIRQEQVKAS